VKLQVAFLPRDVASPAGRVCVVLDILRASSTLVTLLDHGAAPVYVAGSIEGARALAGDRGDAAAAALRPLLCGEVGGLPPPGFDYGNSPTELAAMALRGRPVVLATSNGTRALAALVAAPAVLVGCLLNASAVVTHGLALARTLGADLTLVCAGDANGTEFSLEDALAAGYLVERALAAAHPAEAAALLAAEDHPSQILDDAARAAWRLWRSYAADRSPTAAATAGFADASHGRELARLGFHADLAYCAQTDVSRVVPRLARAGDVLTLHADLAAS
jgi:2-phosphosulfolactate phosphatase